MNIILPFLSGFLAAVIGISPPGLINMTAAKVSMTDGKKRGLIFVLGALFVIFFQAYLSIIFAQYINRHQQVIVLMREIGLVIFAIISIYFLFFAKPPKTIITNDSFQLKSKRSRFFMGMLISIINFFPIPYYVLVSITLASYKMFSFETHAINSLIFGILTGSFLVFYCYIVFFARIKSKTDYFIKNMNTIIGLITGFVAILTLINILNYYF
jgi:threonine/homoserine/homoserine lactone efflux protein